MSEGEAGQGAQPDEAPAQAVVTAGTLLREAREASGLHIAALAVSLKVPVRKLEALEADRLDLLHDAVFVRALASSVCRTLKIDPAPVLQRLPQTEVPRLVRDESGINAPFRAPSDGKGPSLLDQLSRPVFLAVFALLLGALVLIFLPTSQRDDAEVAKADGVPASVMPPPGVMPAPAPADVADTAKVPDLPTAVVTAGASRLPALAPTVTAVVSTPTVMSPTVALSPASTRMTDAATHSAALTAAPARAVTPTVAVSATRTLAAGATRTMAATTATLATPPPPLPSTGTVVLKAKGETWVDVTDAKGVVIVRKTLAAGEVVGASGAMPLAVVIGRVNLTEVQVRGKPFDMSAVARDNVARFEVK